MVPPRGNKDSVAIVIVVVNLTLSPREISTIGFQLSWSVCVVIIIVDMDHK